MNEAPRTKVEKSDAEWQAELNRQQYDVLRRGGTEAAFSHPYNAQKAPGIYRCAGCNAPLFSSETKFDSGTGWPSFYAPVSQDAVAEHEDRKWFMRRTEVRCARCDGHLGHVFPDGPQPTGLRYCMNGVALAFEPKAKAASG